MTMLAAGAALLAAVAGCAAWTGAAAGRKTNVELDGIFPAGWSARPGRAEIRQPSDDPADSRALCGRRNLLEKRYYAGVDGLRGDTRGFCDQVDAYLDDVLREIAAREKCGPEAAGVRHSFSLPRRKRPRVFHIPSASRRDADKLFIRNPYRACPGRVGLFASMIRKLVYSNRYNFSPKSRTWNIWHWLHPDEHFDAPGDWRIVTRLSGGFFGGKIPHPAGRSGESASVPVAGRAAADAGGCAADLLFPGQADAVFPDARPGD